MLEAYILGNELQTGQYTQMQALMEQVILKSMYTKNGWIGVPYELKTNWTPYPNKGSSTQVEDWHSSEAIGIIAEALLSLK
jgi:hypothetical protein